MNPIRKLSVVHFAAAALSLAVALPAGASIGVTTEIVPSFRHPVVFTTGAAAGDGRYFSSDWPEIIVDEKDGELCLTEPLTPWRELQAQLDQGGTVTLLNDVAAQANDESLEVTTTVLLDLAGHTLTGNQSSPVIYVYGGGTLTLTNSVEGLGSITGGGYGGVEVEDGTFEMNGGAISGNYASDFGGGVYVGWIGVFTMNGGTISGNTTDYVGGGVCVDGVFEMNGGAILGNQAGDCGGGVYVYENATFALNGGAISGNYASALGGGVYVYEDAALTVSGGPVVSGNTNTVGEASNVYLPDGQTIAVDGLSAGASIGVTTETVPEAGHPVAIAADATSGDAAHFFSDDSGCHVEMVEGALCLVVGVGLPAYLDGANEIVIANYRAWAAKYGPDVTGAHEAAFLLDIDPATQIPAGAALLKIVDFSITPTRRRIEIASDVAAFEEKETEFPMLGNGFLELLATTSLSPDSDWTHSGPVPFEIRNGRAVIDLENDPESGPMPPALFFKASITPFLDTVIVIGIEE